MNKSAYFKIKILESLFREAQFVFLFAWVTGTSVSVISRYERDEMTPSIDAAKKLALILDTTVGYLLGENEEAELFKEPDMLRRLKDINGLSDDVKQHVLFALDAMLRDAKTKQAYT